MAEGVGPGTTGRVLRMVLVLALGGLVGGFLHLRSVDPAGVADEERAKRVVLRAGDVAGFQVADEDSTAGLRAGLRESSASEPDDEPPEASAQPGTGNFAECLGGDEPGLAERLYERAFGVEPDNRHVTGQAWTRLQQGFEPGGTLPGLLASIVLTLDSESVAAEGFGLLRSGPEASRFVECLGKLFAAIEGRVESLPVTVAGANAVGYRVSAAPSPLPISLTLDLFLLQRGRGVAVLVGARPAEPFPPDQEQALLNLLAERLGAEMGDGQL